METWPQININVFENTLLTFINTDGKIIFNANILFDEHADNRNIDLNQRFDKGIYAVVVSTDKQSQVKKWEL